MDFYTFTKAKLQCEYDANCIAIKHLKCGNVNLSVRSYVTCELGSKIGIRTDNKIFEDEDKKDCIFRKIVEGIFQIIFQKRF